MLGKALRPPRVLTQAVWAEVHCGRPITFCPRKWLRPPDHLHTINQILNPRNPYPSGVGRCTAGASFSSPWKWQTTMVMSSVRISCCSHSR